MTSILELTRGPTPDLTAHAWNRTRTKVEAKQADSLVFTGKNLASHIPLINT